jgi:hypothetical protein
VRRGGALQAAQDEFDAMEMTCNPEKYKKRQGVSGGAWNQLQNHVIEIKGVPQLRRNGFEAKGLHVK